MRSTTTTARRGLRPGPAAVLLAAALAATALLTAGPAAAGAADRDRDGDGGRRPAVRITAPVGGAVAPGTGAPGAGTFEGAGFLINVEARTRDDVAIPVREALNIRNPDLLGAANPNYPGLDVRVDVDLPKPDGGVIPAGTNLANLFNVAGTDDTPGPGVTVWAGWHVLESIPADVDAFTITAAVTDEAGRVGRDRVTLEVDRDGPASGQALTPPPGPVLGDGRDDRDGPRVELNGPRRRSSVATGPAGTPVNPSGSLFFLQVDALDRTGAGIGVSENGPGNGPGQVDAPGSILDAGAIATAGPNRNFPGLVLTFDAALRQPNGNLIPAGQNLAPLFNVAGSQSTHRGVLTTADWVVGGSLELPEGQDTLTVTATVTDAAGRTGSDRSRFGISDTVDGQALTPAP